MPSGPLRANPPSSTIHLTSRVSSWLYAVFAIMAISTFAMAFAARERARGTRVFHQLATVILGTYRNASILICAADDGRFGVMVIAIAAIDYFTMASNLGNTAISTTMRREGTRAIWYTRYIEWTITTPLLLLTLLLATGLPLGDIMTILFFDLVMIVCGLVAALVESDYKWAFFVFGLLSLFYITYHVLAPARASARLLGLDWGRILDIIAKPVYLFMHISALNKLNYADLALQSGKYSDPVDSGVAHHHAMGNAAPHAGQTGTTAVGGFGKRGLGLFGRKEKHEVHEEGGVLQHELSPVPNVSPPTAYAHSNAAI
ncbi:hypothetical protein QFC21_002764 [Naganishia friedmannii]|uniref:Uncharacterized protein n=1 Tax=Naganishia friedmannii TaxID=89922 RepID=A0ACC2VTG5_9TREE|nr:hypothetical protein QFC21_002764 [Naganishia friedmannii]